MPVRACLGDEARPLPRLGQQQVPFGRRQHERLVQEYVNAPADGHHRRQDVLVVRSLDDHGVKFVANLVKQVLIGRELPDRGIVCLGLGIVKRRDLGVHLREHRRIGIDNRDQLLKQDGVDYLPPLRATANQGDADLRAPGDLALARQPEARAADVEERQGRSRDHFLEEIPPIDVHVLPPWISDSLDIGAYYRKSRESQIVRGERKSV